MSEISTARLRALNISMGAATQWLFNFVIARSEKFLLSINSPRYTNLLEAVLAMQATMGNVLHVWIIMTLFTWVFIPKTKGLSLEKMDELFDSLTGKADPEVSEERLGIICEVEAEKNEQP
ncbi:unnamed protein product [Clonostachys rosea]|uniref:Major facilitator superfamily (MFS) profile domain-containing protein n=1 Tax=Bionectria ochroleuca TaxID=29856 RepID=A0ABY6UG71_BIOOC|nr:unnamed protein product [Clonostachys rosea]